MSFVRTFFKVIFAIILTLSLIVSILSLSFYQTTSYKNLGPRITSYIDQQFSTAIQQSTPQELDSLRTQIIENCSGKQETSLSLGDNQGDSPIDLSDIKINCSQINQDTSTEQLIDIASKSIFNSIYFKTYDCKFIKCLSQIKQNPQGISIIASKKANDSLKNLTIWLMLFSLILIVAIILLSKPKYTTFYALAPAFLVSGILFIIRFPITHLTKQIQEPVFGIINSFVSSIFINYIMIFIIGIIFLVLAIVFKSTHIKAKEIEKPKKKKTGVLF